MTDLTNLLLMYGRFAPGTGHQQRLQQLLPGCDITIAKTEQEALDAAKDCQAIIGHRYLKQSLPLCTQLRWIQSFAGGIDNIACKDLIASGATVTRCPIFAEAIAHHALAMAWTLQRRLHRSLELQQQGIWKEPDDFLPPSKKALILGMGEIGLQLARLLKCMGLSVIGVATTESAEKQEHCDRLYTGSNWKRELPDCDLCFLTLPALDSTRLIFDANAIEQLPKHAIVINIGRGETLDEQALFEALDRQRIAGAGLDVLASVPDRNSPVWKISNLIISRKTASFFAGRQQQLEQFIEEQVGRFMSGQPLRFVVHSKTLEASLMGNPS